MKRMILAVLITVMLLCCFINAFAIDNVDGNKQTLYVAVCADYAPFEYMEDGKLCGFDIDLMNYIGERTGYSFVFVNTDFDSLFQSVISGTTDCAISTIAITDQRKSHVDFTHPYIKCDIVYEQTPQVEEYGIIFNRGTIEKSKLINASGGTTPYQLINDSIKQLIKDGTVDKLIKKYNLENHTSTMGYNAIYSVPELIDNNYIEYPSDWAEESVKKALICNVTEYGITYDWRSSITREQFCELVCNFIWAVNGSIDVNSDENRFTDTNNRRVRILNNAGIINGVSENKFAPDEFLTREQAATIIVRMINREMPMPVTKMQFDFEDSNDISDWASDSVQAICNLGFMLGVGDKKFVPQDKYTVEQAVVTLMRIYDTVKKPNVYKTPLGDIVSTHDYKSYINFGISCNAIIHLTEDISRSEETHYIIEKPVKSLTNQTSSMYISFDDFASAFGGEWKLNDGIFEFSYDEKSTVTLVKGDNKIAAPRYEWPNKTQPINVISFSPDMDKILVNGEFEDIKSQYGGKVNNGCITMYQDELYIPVQMVAQLLGFDIAYLEVVDK